MTDKNNTDRGGSTVWVTDNRPVNIRDFATGSIGNGENADSAISSALSFARSNGRHLYFSRGVYGITQSVALTDSGNQDVGRAIYGDQPTWDTVAQIGAVLRWDGTTTDPMIKVLGRGNRIEGLSLQVASGKSTVAGISWDKYQNAATRLEVIGVQIVAGASQSMGTMTDGIVIGPTASVYNLDMATIERCSIGGQAQSAVHIASTTGQSRGHHIANCMLGAGSTPYGILLNTGNFRGYNLQLCGSTACVGVKGGAQCSIDGFMSEGAAALLKQYPGTGVTLPWPVELSNGHFSVGDTAGEYAIDIVSAGPLILRNVNFGYAGTFNPTTKGKIRVGAKRAAGPPNDVASIVSIGNMYLQQTPWTTSAAAGSPAHVDVCTLGDRYTSFGASSPYVPMTGQPPIASALDYRITV